jgi:hypothetical protein
MAAGSLLAGQVQPPCRSDMMPAMTEPMVYYVVATETGPAQVWHRAVSDTKVEAIIQAMGGTLIKRCDTLDEANRLQQDITRQRYGITAGA